uniref:Tetratricopeptide repeat protein n=1 Tax=Eiseniibacteriota bacterium TaxID=2212470 RepID=A0A832IAY3_UNCEI
MRPGRAPAAAAPADESAGGAARLLWLWLAALSALRAATALLPGMAAWGVNVQRFLDPVWAWTPWALAAAALLPWLARPALAACAAAARAAERAPWAGAAALAALAAALVAWLPDRLRFVGDALLRLGAVEGGESPEVLSPQAFPLDVWIHFTLPRALVGAGLEREAAIHAVGVAGAALLGAAAAHFGRAAARAPEARLAAAAAVLGGGTLALFAGENKAFAELAVVVLAFAACALAAAAGGAGLAGMSVTLALGLGLHRYALGLVPAFGLVWMLRLRPGAPRPGRLDLLSLAAPAAVLAWLGPRLWRTLVTYDLPTNFAPSEPSGGAAPLAAWLAPGRLADLANLLLLLAPLAPVAPALAWLARRPAAAHPGRHVMLALALPFAAAFALARPPQGAVRDWDSFAVPALALAAAAAWWAARAIEGARRTWLAVPLALGLVAPAAQWLAHAHDPARGMARLEALVTEPPGRPPADRARISDFLGWRHWLDGDYAQAARAFERAAEAAPSPRMLTHVAMAESMLGRHERALAFYRRATERDSSFTLAWIGVAVSALNAGDLAVARAAAARLAALAPDDPKTVEILRALAARDAP